MDKGQSVFANIDIPYRCGKCGASNTILKGSYRPIDGIYQAVDALLPGTERLLRLAQRVAALGYRGRISLVRKSDAILQDLLTLPHGEIQAVLGKLQFAGIGAAPAPEVAIPQVEAFRWWPKVTSDRIALAGLLWLIIQTLLPYLVTPDQKLSEEQQAEIVAKALAELDQRLAKEAEAAYDRAVPDEPGVETGEEVNACLEAEPQVSAPEE